MVQFVFEIYPQQDATAKVKINKLLICQKYQNGGKLDNKYGSMTVNFIGNKLYSQVGLQLPSSALGKIN